MSGKNKKSKKHTYIPKTSSSEDTRLSHSTDHEKGDDCCIVEEILHQQSVSASSNPCMNPAQKMQAVGSEESELSSDKTFLTSIAPYQLSILDQYPHTSQPSTTQSQVHMTRGTTTSSTYQHGGVDQYSYSSQPSTTQSQVHMTRGTTTSSTYQHGGVDQYSYSSQPSTTQSQVHMTRGTSTYQHGGVDKYSYSSQPSTTQSQVHMTQGMSTSSTYQHGDTRQYSQTSQHSTSRPRECVTRPRTSIVSTYQRGFMDQYSQTSQPSTTKPQVNKMQGTSNSSPYQYSNMDQYSETSQHLDTTGPLAHGISNPSMKELGIVDQYFQTSHPSNRHQTAAVHYTNISYTKPVPLKTAEEFNVESTAAISVSNETTETPEDTSVPVKITREKQEILDHCMALKLQAHFNEEFNADSTVKVQEGNQKRIDMKKNSFASANMKNTSDTSSMTNTDVKNNNMMCSPPLLDESLTYPQQLPHKLEKPDLALATSDVKQELDKVMEQQNASVSERETTAKYFDLQDNYKRNTRKNYLYKSAYDFWQSMTGSSTTQNKTPGSTKCPADELKQDIHSELNTLKESTGNEIKSVDVNGKKEKKAEDHQKKESELPKNNESYNKGAVKKTNMYVAENQEQISSRQGVGPETDGNMRQCINTNQGGDLKNYSSTIPSVPCKKYKKGSEEKMELPATKVEGKGGKQSDQQKPNKQPNTSLGSSNYTSEKISKKTADQGEDLKKKSASSSNDQADDLLIACILGHMDPHFSGDASQLALNYLKKFSTLISAAEILHAYVKTFFGPLNKVKLIQENIKHELKRLEHFPTYSLSPYKENIEKAIQSLISSSKLLENRIPMIEENYKMPSGKKQKTQTVTEVPPSPEYQKTLPIAMEALRLFREVCCDERKWTRGKVRVLGEQLIGCQTQLDDINMKREDEKAVNARRDVLNLCNVALKKHADLEKKHLMCSPCLHDVSCPTLDVENNSTHHGYPTKSPTD